MKAIETHRLLLRNFCRDDKSDLFELLSDEQTCLDDGGYHAYASIDQPGFLRVFDILSKSEEHYAVTLKSSGKVIGLVHIMQADRSVKAVELGYSIGKDFRRRGYAKEAVGAVIRKSFESGAEMIVCTCYEYNEASAGVLKSLGFTFEGRIHKSCMHPQKGLIDSLSFYLDKE